MNLDYARYWNRVARERSIQNHSNYLLAEHKRKTYLNLLSRWTEITPNQRVLKTDLFEEAFNNDNEQFSFDLAKLNSHILAIDVSSEIAQRAKANARYNKINGEYICGDVRQLPFRNDSFDLIISNSTLDHFHDQKSILVALTELRRIMRTGGTLILTLDNKDNLTYPPYIFIRLWMQLRLAPYFIGKTLSPRELTHALTQSGFRVEESTAVFHYPHPDRLVRGLEIFLHCLGNGKFNTAIRKSLTLLDKLEQKRTRYLTGRYIAVKAVKTDTP